MSSANPASHSDRLEGEARDRAAIGYTLKPLRGPWEKLARTSDTSNIGVINIGA